MPDITGKEVHRRVSNKRATYSFTQQGNRPVSKGNISQLQPANMA